MTDRALYFHCEVIASKKVDGRCVLGILFISIEERWKITPVIGYVMIGFVVFDKDPAVCFAVFVFFLPHHHSFVALLAL